MGNNSRIHNFLDIVGSQHRPAGLTARHNVLMIAKNRKAGGCQRPGGDVEHRGGKFPGYLIHIGDHKKQALGGGKCCRKRPNG